MYILSLFSINRVAILFYFPFVFFYSEIQISNIKLRFTLQNIYIYIKRFYIHDLSRITYPTLIGMIKNLYA